MAEIIFRKKELQNAIDKLNALRKAETMMRRTPPQTVGGGQAVTEMKELGKIFLQVSEHFETLLTNTIAFLQNAHDTMKETDELLIKLIRPFEGPTKFTEVFKDAAQVSPQNSTTDATP